MPKKKRVDAQEYTVTIQRQVMEEFGRLDLPLEVKVRARNLASEQSVTVRQALAALIEMAGSFEELIKDCKDDTKRLRQGSKRVLERRGGSAVGVFGSTALTPGAPPLQGGAVGLGKRSVMK
jgi:hypothetical protein